MKRSPSSWSETLARLGFRRNWRGKKKSTPVRGFVRLGLEPLEDRWLLAVVVVGNDTDFVNGNTTSISTLTAPGGDGGDGISLREAILAANASSAHDDIMFSLGAGSHEIDLTNGELFIEESLTIHGLGRNALTIDAQGNSRVLNIANPQDDVIEVEIKDVKLANGGGSSYGGAIYSDYANLTIRDTIITGSQALRGGGIYFNGGYSANNSLLIAGSTIAGNTAYSGGGLETDTACTVTIVNSTISGNTASNGRGGGANLRDTIGVASILGSTFSGNHALGSYGKGGGLSAYNGIFNDTVTYLRNSTFSDNDASQVGGGLHFYSSNFLQIGYEFFKTAHFSNVTITKNEAPVGGGVAREGRDQNGIVTSAQGPDLLLHNSVVSGNVQPGTTTPSNISGNAVGYYSLVGTGGSGGLVHNQDGNKISDAPMLGSLSLNGGTTATHVPQTGSPLINAGSQAVAFDLSDFDQRGNVRILSGRIDIGAVESDGLATPPGAPNGAVDLATVVSNLSFEELVNPNDYPNDISIPHNSQFDKSVAWDQLSNGTSDYWHFSGFTGGAYGLGVAPPQTYVEAGDGFAGFVEQPSAPWSEYVVNVLDEPLTAGTAYYFDLYVGTLSETPDVYSGYNGEVIIYGILDASLIDSYLIDAYDPPPDTLQESRRIEAFALGNYVELLSVPVEQPASTWMPFLNQSFTPTVPIEALVIGTRAAVDVVGSRESYVLVDITGTTPPSADFDDDGDVDGRDFLIWQRGFGLTGQTSNEFGDANFDGVVNEKDLQVWRDQYGTTSTPPPSADFDDDGDVDGRDFLTWQRNFGASGQTSNVNGDANFDGMVDSADLTIWKEQYGQSTTPPPQPAVVSADFNGDELVDTSDLAVWQSGFGTAAAAEHSSGDADFDGDVDANDLLVWEVQFTYSNMSHTQDADFNNDGDVDGSDFLTWQSGYGTPGAQHGDGDADFDGDVDGDDLSIWQDQYGPANAPKSADFDADGDVDGADFLTWQRGFGIASGASHSQGDADYDGDVDCNDRIYWEAQYDGVLNFDALEVAASSAAALTTFTASTIIVSTLNDENDGDYGFGDLSLREAISIAANTTSADTIVFAPGLSGTIDLTSELFLGAGVDSDITIDGPGADVISINAEANWLSHVFNVTSYADIENFTIRNLRLTGSSSGAIHVQGALNRHVTLDGVEISDNWGTGIWVEGGDLTVTRSEIARNWVYGIDFSGYGNLIVDRSTFHDNEGIAIGVANSTGKIINTTVSGNHTSDETGGVWVNGSTVLLTNVTLTGNDGTMTGGLYSTRGGVATLHNSIVAGNTSGAAASNVSLSSYWGNGSIGATSSSNLFGTVPSGAVPSGNNNLTGVSTASIGLAPLGEYGGTTPTHMLLAGSIALNAGSNSKALDANGQTLAVDQRGLPRITGGNVDIGAVEASSGSVLTVGTLVDENDSNHTGGDYSLREALDDASAYAGVETIQFSPSLSGTLTLSLGQLVIDSNLNLLGPGADVVTISGNNASRVLSVNNGITASIQDVRIADGYVASNGGGIYSLGNLMVNRVAIEDNYSYAGGGLYASGTLNVSNSTIADNIGYYIGGGAYLYSATATLTNTTVSSNDATYGGGGLYIGSSTVAIAHSTVTQNRSTTSSSGGGVYIGSGTVSLSHSIVADNFYGTGSSESDIYGSLNTSVSRYNLIGTGGNGGLTSSNGNLVGIATPGLTSLGDHGGALRTHALLLGSLAVDSGDSAITGEPEFDARGRTRIDDGDFDELVRIDIGAFELAADEYFGSIGA